MNNYRKYREEMEAFIQGMGAEPVSPEERTFSKRARAQREHPDTKRDAHRIQYHRTWRGEQQTKNPIQAIYGLDGWKTPTAKDPTKLTRSPEPPRQNPAGKRNYGRAH